MFSIFFKNQFTNDFQIKLLVAVAVVLIFNTTYASQKPVKFQKKDSIIQDYLEKHKCTRQAFYYFCGSKSHLKRLQYWFAEVGKTEIGLETIEAIKRARHDFLVAHEPASVNTAGKTLSKLTSRLSNGEGTEAVVLMNFNIPDLGSHRVAAVSRSRTGVQFTEFTAVQNFFHELSHVKHTLWGTMATMREVQAIEEENIFRTQEAQINNTVGIYLRNYRGYEDDIQTWFPENDNIDLLSFAIQ